MPRTYQKLFLTLMLVPAMVLASVVTPAIADKKKGALVIKEQGSFTVGGRSLCAPGEFDPTAPFFPISQAGQCYEIDHLYAQYQIPPNARNLPIVFIHGGAGTGVVWETTPGGKEGFRTIFLRRGFPVYVVDFPRRGRAGIPTFSETFGEFDGEPIVGPTPLAISCQRGFNNWRIGDPADFPNPFPGSQFPAEGLLQFCDGIVPIISDNSTVIADSIIALLDRIGPAILMTHSQSGIFGFDVALRSDNVKGIIVIEGSYMFPDDDVPDPLPRCDGTLFAQGRVIPAADFAKLAKIPTLVIYGDNVPEECPTTSITRLLRASGSNFVDALNARGGSSLFIDLPSIGITGNSHFPYLEKNNVEIADLISDFMKETGLDKP